MAKKVLISDPAAFVRHLIVAKTLSDAGYETFEVQNGEETLQKCAEISPDLVMLEITTGGGRDGLEISKEIRKQYPDTKTIILGSLTYELFSMEAAKAGACCYLKKPFKANTVLQAVRDAIGGSGAAGEAEAIAKAEEASTSQLPDRISFKPFG